MTFRGRPVGGKIGGTRRCRVGRSRILVIGKLAVVLACAIALPAVAADSVELLAPSQGTALLMKKGVPITFTWKADSGQPLYRFQLSRLPDFRELLADRELARTSTLVRDLGAGRYYWRCSGDGSEWSPTLGFTLRVEDRRSGGR